MPNPNQMPDPEAQAVEPARVRQLWHLLEPLHAVFYFAPESVEEAAALGFAVDERWRSYFAWRAAPLGPAGRERVTATFYSFSPETVGRHVPAVWDIAAPEAVLAAQQRAVDRMYRSILGARVEAPELAQAAALARRAAEAAAQAVASDPVDRPLAAANAALPWPDEPHQVLWQAATVLREHRGDGHLAALRAADLDPVESLVSFVAVGAAASETFESRGWTGKEWEAARRRLLERGLLGEDGTATEAGRALRAEVEDRTDELAAGPWRALGARDTGRLADLLGDPWVAVLGSGLLPGQNTLGIGRS
ncbi:hypothetical protein RCO28_33755 [Streptomyces sp. LHD-70]|uniref:SCO6745 family protein n=1 Tax=Streptomyces sp. LHD-70 TaxID=3072140 RepID=UPI00280E9CBD|nr:hypothetical protein [Streptomyces sp. LHD-70]MDQ8707397.1 hypothetical protein [Streptomyces sp. LHD-70]